MVRLSLAAGLAGLAGVAGFQRQAPQRPTTVLQYKKTAKEMRAKYPEGGKVPYVLTKDAPPHGVAGDVLKVNRGFANNYLAPQGLGEPAMRGRGESVQRRPIPQPRRPGLDAHGHCMRRDKLFPAWQL